MSVREYFELALNVEQRCRYESDCPCGGGCESALECEFWYWLKFKTHGGDFRAIRQVPIGQFRVDCLIECGSQLVVVELDGKAFHQGRSVQDNRRDCELIKQVDAIIRIPYAALHHFPRATFRVLEEWFPRFAVRQEIFVINVWDLANEIEKSVDFDGDFLTPRDWLNWADSRFELWALVLNSVGWVGSPLAWLKQWNVTPITLRRRGFLDQFTPSHGSIRAHCAKLLKKDLERKESIA